MIQRRTHGIDLNSWYRLGLTVQTRTHCRDLDSWYSIGTLESDTYKRVGCCPYADFFLCTLRLFQFLTQHVMCGTVQKSQHVWQLYVNSKYCILARQGMVLILLYFAFFICMYASVILSYFSIYGGPGQKMWPMGIWAYGYIDNMEARSYTEIFYPCIPYTALQCEICRGRKPHALLKWSRFDDWHLQPQYF